MYEKFDLMPFTQSCKHNRACSNKNTIFQLTDADVESEIMSTTNVTQKLPGFLIRKL